ncbi:MAG: hypothetical protein CL807_05760 [Citromicrobium sp.]|nr:hypothetical protein [Citromicrobium sp.]MAO95794.1 hypothetical protein [Citromicrobium sp.]MBD76392.1 hypothetical protein [Citromicrobium sp.]MBT46295.1 hypothetical protein [Citromicrobium sp.]|tara:strand:+ start:5104 stop:5550 length:447 start_codon:yes stop_codon:yes gene_type:complete
MAENTDTALSVSGQMSWREKKALHDAAVAEYDRHEEGTLRKLESEYKSRWPMWPSQMTDADRAAAEAWSRVSGRDAAIERTEVLSNRWSALQSELLKMPTDDPEAIIWKLDFLFACDDGSLDPWSAEIVRPALEDVRRALLGERAHTQ